MSVYIVSIAFVVMVYAAIIWLAERRGLLRCDNFVSPAAKAFAYAWLGFFMVLIAALVTSSALNPARSSDLARAPFYSLFAMHAILTIFLAGWWVAVGRPPLSSFLNFHTERAGESVLAGVAVGVGGWMATIAAALIVAMALSGLGLIEDPQPSPVIGYMAALAWWKKAIIVMSAMTIEEFFFRSFLQKRIGLIASTVLFALAHFTLGQPLLLIGVTVISLIIGYTFYRTKNVIPGIIAHGVFDAIQLFVIIPVVFRMTGMQAG